MNYLWLTNILLVCTMFNYKLISLGAFYTRVFIFMLWVIDLSHPKIRISFNCMQLICYCVLFIFFDFSCFFQKGTNFILIMSIFNCNNISVLANSVEFNGTLNFPILRWLKVARSRKLLWPWKSIDNPGVYDVCLNYIRSIGLLSIGLVKCTVISTVYGNCLLNARYRRGAYTRLYLYTFA